MHTHYYKTLITVVALKQKCRLNAQLFFVFTAKTNSIAFGSPIRTVVSVQPFVRIGCKLGLYG